MCKIVFSLFDVIMRKVCRNCWFNVYDSVFLFLIQIYVSIFEIHSNQVILPDGMVVDPEARRLYWADGQIGTLFRSYLDGANVASFVTGIDKPRALTLHQRNG